jgi:hypothetical protein
MKDKLGWVAVAILFGSVGWIQLANSAHDVGIFDFGPLHPLVGASIAFCFCSVGLVRSVLAEVRVNRAPTGTRARHIAFGIVVLSSALASRFDLAEKVRFAFERSEVEATMRQVRERCLSKSAPSPVYRGKQIDHFLCRPGRVEFAAGRWGTLFNGGEWGFAEGDPSSPLLAGADAAAVGIMVRKSFHQWSDWYVWYDTST